MKIIIHLIADYDGLFMSNGPGDPVMLSATVNNLKRLLELDQNIPVFGICMGHQILSLAAGCKAFKMKYVSLSLYWQASLLNY